MALDALDRAGLPLPSRIRTALAGLAQADGRTILMFTAEAIAIDALFASAGVTMRVLKGPPLAMLAYGELAMRQSRDLDLLVDATQLRAACSALRDAGYRQVAPGGDASEQMLDLWSRMRKDIGFVSPRTGAYIELHQRLTDNPKLLATRPAASDFAPIAVGPGRYLSGLTGDPLLLYLCVHGAQHGWFRIKWLADVAALLRAAPDGTIERLHDLAVREGAALHLGQALRLCRRLFATPVPETVARRLDASPRLARLERAALTLMADPREPAAHRTGTTRLTLYQFLLGTSPGDLAFQALASLSDLRLALAWGGSRTAVAASIAARPLLWSWRKLTRADLVAAPPR